MERYPSQSQMTSEATPLTYWSNPSEFITQCSEYIRSLPRTTCAADQSDWCEQEETQNPIITIHSPDTPHLLLPSPGGDDLVDLDILSARGLQCVDVDKAKQCIAGMTSDSDARWRYIHKLSDDGFFTPGFSCSKCPALVTQDNMYQCQTCFDIICRECHTEMVTGEPTPGSQSYEYRVDSLRLCVQHNSLRVINTAAARGPGRYCDICHEEGGIVGGAQSWTDSVTWTQLVDTKDVCLSCADTEEGRAFLAQEVQMFLHTWPVRIGLNVVVGLGPLADWVPVCVDEEGNLVLARVAVTDGSNPNFKCAVVVYDDHGRMGLVGITDTVKEFLTACHANGETVIEAIEKKEFSTYYG
jgi:hypothetical protein